MYVVEEHIVGNRDYTPGWLRLWKPLPYLSGADLMFLARAMTTGRVFRIVPESESPSQDRGFAPPS